MCMYLNWVCIYEGCIDMIFTLIAELVISIDRFIPDSRIIFFSETQFFFEYTQKKN